MNKSEIIKVWVLDLKRKTIDEIGPVRYELERDFDPFFRRIMPSLREEKEILFFLNSYEEPVARLALPAAPSARFWQVVVVIGVDFTDIELNQKKHLFESVRIIMGEEAAASLKAFLYDNDPPRDVFESAFQCFRVIPVALPLRDWFAGYEGIVSFQKISRKGAALEKGGFELKYYTRESIKSLIISHSFLEKRDEDIVTRDLILLKDVASLDVPFQIHQIKHVVESYLGLHVEHLRKDGRIELKTFIPEYDGNGQPATRYRDSGNRKKSMRSLYRGGEVISLSRHLILESYGFSENDTYWRELRSSIKGEICNIFQAGTNEYYILSWEKAHGEVTIWPFTPEKRIPSDSDLIRFSSDIKPNRLVWVEDMDLFFLAKEGMNTIYLLPRSSGEGNPIDVSSVFSHYDQGRLMKSFESYGVVRDLFSSSWKSGEKEIPFLIVAQKDRIGFFLIQIQ